MGIEPDDTAYDTDIVVYINGVLMVLNQLGIGSDKTFAIADASATWYDFLGENDDIEAVKTFIYLKVRLVFDPPTGGVLDALERMAKEYEWRLTVIAETIRLNSETDDTDEGGTSSDE